MESLNIKLWKYSTALSIFGTSVILSIITWRHYAQYAQLVNRIQSLTVQAAPFKPLKKTYRSLQAAQKQSPHPLTFITTVSAIIADHVHLVSYQYEHKKNIILMGKAKTDGDIILFMQALQKLPGCAHLSLAGTQHASQQELTFTMIIPSEERSHDTH